MFPSNLSRLPGAVRTAATRAVAAGLAAPLLLLAGCETPAGQAQPSLYDKRLGVMTGQTPGIELMPARKASEADGGGPLRLPPPTGRPMNESKKVDSPDHGIPLPTAR